MSDKLLDEIAVVLSLIPEDYDGEGNVAAAMALMTIQDHGLEWLRALVPRCRQAEVKEGEFS